jgi:hypothetical protein
VAPLAQAVREDATGHDPQRAEDEHQRAVRECDADGLEAVHPDHVGRRPEGQRVEQQCQQ